jgi:hypothetical protein
VKARIIIAIIISLLLIPAIPTIKVESASPGWIIDGDTVYIDDANVYLSATPHTLASSGWVEFQLLSKNYEGPIDVVWGFNTAEGMKPGRPQVWAENVPHEKYNLVEGEASDTITISEIISFTKLNWASFSGDPDIGNNNNTYLYEVTISAPEEPNGTLTLVVAFNSYDLQGDSVTITYNYTTQIRQYYIDYYDDWKPLELPIVTLNIEWKGADKWRLLEVDTPIVKDTLYRVRMWVEIPFGGIDGVTGKYSFAVKPSHETFREAVRNGHLYFLDPWWDSSWLYKKKITFDNSASTENLINFPVLIHLDDTNIDWTHVQNAGQDIRFTDSDESTELDFEIERWDDTNDAWLWVEVPQIDLGSTTDHIYMYYGNAGASDGQDVSGTWNDNYLLVTHSQDDPDTSHISDSTINNNDGVKFAANEPIEINGQIGKAQDYDGTDDYVDPPNLGLTPENLTLEAWIKLETGKVGWLLAKAVNTGWARDWSLYIGTGLLIQFWFGNNNPDAVNLNTAGGLISAGTWAYITATRDGSDARIFIDDTEVASVGYAFTPTDKGHDAVIATRRPTPHAGRYFIGIIDEVRISNVARSGEWIEAQYLSMTEAYVTFAGEEDVPLPEPPSSFTLTAVSDNQVDITWVKDPTATNTEIRREINEYPTSRTDGVQVYYGAGESVSDTADEVGLELDKSTYYYRAWSENVIGWSLDYAQDYIGGENMGALASALGSLSTVGLTWLALLAVVGISGLAFWKPMAPIFMILAAMSMMLGLSWYDVHATELGMGISLGLIAYSIVCLGLTYRVIFQARPAETEAE